MARSFKKLRDGMPPEHRKRAAARARKVVKNINLRELRQAIALTQQELAESLGINQAAISKMESQSDMYLSTLRRVLAAMGAELKIVAEFPDGDEVVIGQFSDPGKSKRSRASAG